jgi:hypothetical protein
MVSLKVNGLPVIKTPLKGAETGQAQRNIDIIRNRQVILTSFVKSFYNLLDQVEVLAS